MVSVVSNIVPDKNTLSLYDQLKHFLAIKNHMFEGYLQWAPEFVCKFCIAKSIFV